MDRIASRLAEVGVVELDDYLDGKTALVDHRDDVTRLHEACQRALHTTDPLKFEYTTNKQCILTITLPDGARRSYATQPAFAKKKEAKLEAARIAIEMGALDFIASANPAPGSSSAPSSDVISSAADDIEQCCIEWRTTLHWVPFFDAKSPHKQGCALRIQLSPHVARIYVSDSTSDAYLDAKVACAKAAVANGVLDFIKHGSGRSPPSSSIATSQPPPVNNAIPWTLQAFYESLPRPFPEHFESNDVAEINPLAWMNSMSQCARGGKLIVSFFFTSDGPPGLHGCLLKLDRPGEYRAFLVDARFTKRSDAKAAVCLQAMSEGIGDYIRSIASSVDNNVTPNMRSFSGSLVYPALTSGLSKIDSDLHPHFEYSKERDAFGATLLVRLSTLPTAHQVRRYTVPSDYRSKADAKVAVICLAAAEGVAEFIRFRGGPVPHGYVSPYSLHTYNPDASKKRKQSGSAEDMEQSQPAKKKNKKGKRRAEAASQGDGARVGNYPSVYSSSAQMLGMSGPGDMGLSQSHPMADLYDPSQPGVGDGVRSGTARPVVYDHGVSLNAQMYASSYPVVPDPRRVCGSGYVVQPVVYGAGSYPSRAIGATHLDSRPSHARPSSSSRILPRPAEDAELEPGEVVSSAESDFSVSSSRDEGDDDVPTIGREIEKSDSDVVVERRMDKSEAMVVSPANTSTTVSRDGPGTTVISPASHVQSLIEYCRQRGGGMPAFHDVQCQGRYQVWIVIGKERFDLPTMYATAEEGRQRVAKQVLARLSTESSG